MSVHDGCTVQLLVDARPLLRRADLPAERQRRPTADGYLRGLFTFTVFDAQGMATCQETVDATLAPWFTSFAALSDAR